MTKAKCNRCGRKVAAKVPESGDGSVMITYRHKDSSANVCWSEVDPESTWEE